MKKKILFSGKLGYHEENITQPIIDGLSEYFIIDRIGESFDFFVPSNIPEIQDNYLSAIPRLERLKEYDAVFFVDYWNPIVPFFQFGRYYHNPTLKFIGLNHGTVEMEGDVACDIQCSKEYEYYLNRVMDLLIVSRPFMVDLLQTEKNNVWFGSYPMDHIINRTPRYVQRNRVVFAHRYHTDKGIDEFETFAKHARNSGIDIEFMVAGKNEPEALQRIKDNGFEWLGHLNSAGMQELGKMGGYTWSSVKSELNGYAVWNLVSFGLTPLLNDHPAYYAFDKKFIYRNFDDALQKIKSGLVMNSEDWDVLKRSEFGNVEKITKKIKDLLYV